jgi:acetyl-CoA carboxylase biotin carboxyl carrier protein
VGVLSYEQIKELVELVAKHRLASFELERSGFRLHLAGPAAEPRSAPATAPAAPPPSPAPSPGAATAEVAAGTAAAVAPPSGAPSGAHVLTSPIVGTFYAAPAPEAEPFTRIGERVRKGQVLCIIEAMKLMNEIECDVDGVVEEVFPRNAQPVEFGEPLFAIRPD